jgi:hypothetical protein
MIRSGTTNPYIRAFHQGDATSQPKPDPSSSNVDGSGIGTKSYCSLNTAVVPEKLAMNVSRANAVQSQVKDLLSGSDVLTDKTSCEGKWRGIGAKLSGRQYR